MVTYHVGTKLPNKIDNFNVQEDGTLEQGGMTEFPGFNEAGYLGGRVRYKLVAEEITCQTLT